ncbi:MAG: hypothetical protein HXM42_09545 [Lautropia mirabilis]|nr:hypothetical protein [Lautropia mirabilis]
MNYGANENKAVGANVFNGNNANEIPAFIRITAIHGKNAGSSHGLMTLENGEEIVVGQVISRADFERIFWNASKSDGSFSFVPVQDAQGTTAPNTVEQTVVIKTPDPLAPGSNPGTSSGEGGNTGHEAGSQTGAGSGTGSSTGNGANTGANAGTGTVNNGTDPNNTTGQQSGNDKGDGTAQNTGSPSGTGEASNQSASSGDGTAPAGGKPGAEGSGSENKPVTGSGSDSTSGSASGSGSAGGSGSTSGSDRNNGSGSDKGGSTPSEGQSSQASNGQAPSQNAGGQGSESQPPAQTPSGQGSSEQTTSPTQGSSSGEQTPPQNAGGGSDTGTPGAGESTQTGGAQTGGAQTGTSETESSGTGDNGKQTSDGEQTSDVGQNGAADGDDKQNGDGDAKHEGDGAEGDGTKGEDTKGEEGEQGKNGEDTASPSNPPVTTPPPTPPDYAPNQSVQQAIHANNKPVGASIFNGTNPAHAPSFVKITAVLDRDGEEVPGAMTLGKDGEAITTDQVISKEQFDNVFLDALKAPGGSFKFIPVMDSEGTEMPGATEQTVSIGFDYVHHFQSEPFREGYEGEDRFSYYRIHSLTEHQDTNGTLDGMFKLDGGERTTLKLGDLIRPEDFDKLYWDYSSNNGGRFTLVGVDASGRDLTDEKNQNMVLEEVAKTRTGRLPPDEPGGEETDVEDSEDSNDIAGHSAALHPESFTDAASAFHGSSHLSVNGQSTLDNLLEHQVSHGIL